MRRQSRFKPVHVIGGAVVLGTAALLVFMSAPSGDTKQADPMPGKTTATAAQDAGAKITPTVNDAPLSATPPGQKNPSGH